MAKIQVPEGMMNAAIARQQAGGDWFEILTAALQWQDAKLAEMVKKRETMEDFYRSPSLADSYHDNGYNVAIHDIRRMFLAEPEKNRCCQEWLAMNAADEKEKHTCCLLLGHSGVHQCLCYNGGICRGCTTDAEPEIPEEVKDLLWDLTHSAWKATGEKHNTEVLEAFRRGRSMGCV